MKEQKEQRAHTVRVHPSYTTTPSTQQTSTRGLEAENEVIPEFRGVTAHEHTGFGKTHRAYTCVCVCV